VSPLTKLFVVLLVILSLLTTSAVVVFVNQVENYSVQLGTARTQLAAMETDRNNAQAALSSQMAIAQSAISQSQAEAERMRQGMNQLQQRINDLAAQNADLTSRIALQSADLTRVTESLKAAQDQNGKKDEMVAQLRTTNDDRLKQNVELNTQVTSLTNDLQVTERERRFLAEQLTESKRTVDRQSSVIRDAGISPKMASAGTGAGAPPINGVIRSTSTIAGVPYASISVGSNDGVTKGMEFKVVDRGSGDFLGVLTVDSVEPTESTGRLSGPGLKRIKTGVDVRTQL